MRMHFLRASLLLFVLSMFSRAEAQILVYQQNKCDMAQVEELRAFTDSALVPIWQEFVDEGKIMAAHSAYHLWGDEWNVVYWVIAEDLASLTEATSAMMGRFYERHPDGVKLWFDACFEHKDSIYYMGGGAEAASSADQ